MNEQTAPTSEHPTWHARLGDWWHGVTRKVTEKGTAIKEQGVALKEKAVTTVAAVQETAKLEPVVTSMREELSGVRGTTEEVRRAIEAQGQRHEEMMRYVETLPELLRAVPDKLGAMDE